MFVFDDEMKQMVKKKIRFVAVHIKYMMKYG